jgi:uncharacterized protein (DUF362 family)
MSIPPTAPSDCQQSPTVAIYSDADCNYSSVAPYHPRIRYPEYRFADVSLDGSKDGKPDAYHAVRETLRLLGYDKEQFGTPEWNPLGHVISPGNNVVIKPNFVLHVNEAGYDIYAGVTHPSVLRAIADYCFIALEGKGSLCIAENPQMDCDFEALRDLIDLDSLTEFYKNAAGLAFPIFDTRRLRCTHDYERELYPSESFVLTDSADPLGYAIVDLGHSSCLDELPGLDNLYGADFDRKFTAENHHAGIHRYCISKTILNADTVICVPKLKTHKKVGVTLNMKLLVGINGDKNYLAHFRVGSPEHNGDEFPDTSRGDIKMARGFSRFLADRILTKRSKVSDRIYLAAKGTTRRVAHFGRRLGILKYPEQQDRIRGGNWPGNDTAWRMSVDLARIIHYADAEGLLHEETQRKVISFVDGIIAGEGDGPMAAKPKHVGAIVAGENVLAVDTAATTFMGFDYRKIKTIETCWHGARMPLALFSVEKTRVSSNDAGLDGKTASTCLKHSFLAHQNWRGHIELSELRRDDSTSFEE